LSISFCLSVRPLPPCSTLFPYTTLFRSILHHAQGNLVLQFLRLEARRAFLDQKAFHLVVCHVTRPDDGHVTEGGIADPFLLPVEDRKSTRLNSSHEWISYAVFCLKKKNI